MSCCLFFNPNWVPHAQCVLEFWLRHALSLDTRSILQLSLAAMALPVVLMVAEKPSLARSLAEILSKKQCRRRKSVCSACDVYEFEGAFLPGVGRATFKMTSVCGHVMSLDFQPQYNKWEQIDPVRIPTLIHAHTHSTCDAVCWFVCR